MKPLIIMVSIMIFWLMLFITLSYVLADTSLIEINVNTSNFNVTSENINFNELQNQGSLSRFIDAVKIMFAYHIPTATFPKGIINILSSINWLLVIVFGICIYRVANPFA